MAQSAVINGLLVMCSEYPEPLLSMLEEYRPYSDGGDGLG